MHDRHIGIMKSSSNWSSLSVASPFWFPIDNFCRDAYILFKVYISLQHSEMLVKFEGSVTPAVGKSLWFSVTKKVSEYDQEIP